MPFVSYFEKEKSQEKAFCCCCPMSDSSQLFFPPPPSHKAPVSPCKTSLLSVSPFVIIIGFTFKGIATSTVITVKIIISHHHQRPNIFLGSVKPNTLLSFSCSSATKIKGIGTLQYENGVREKIIKKGRRNLTDVSLGR